MFGYKPVVLLTLLFSSVVSALVDTLVIVDKEEVGQYSRLLQAMEENGLATAVKNPTAEEERPLLDANNAVLYSNLVVLASNAKRLGSNLDSEELLKYANNGGNIVIVSDGEQSQLDCTLYLNQLGIFPSPKGYRYTDHHHGELEFTAAEFLNPHVVSPAGATVKLQQPSVALVSNSEYLIPLLQTPRSSFTESKADKWHTGNQGFFAVAFQALNNQRTTWFGSAAPFKDESFNPDLANDIIRWTCQLKSVIKATVFTHRRVDAEGHDLPFVDEDDYYKIKDLSYFEIGLSEYNAGSDSWVPYNAESNMDVVQLEFIMLDPYQRLNLNHSSDTPSEAIYSALFQIPDQHGMFTFSVDYKRPGLSFVTVTDVVPVRHLANDEYQRSWEIPNSSVYMAGYGIVVVGWLFFVVFFVLSKNKSIETAKKNV